MTDAVSPSSGKIPRLSVGLAVYNGEDYLEEAIESILAQTFTDFELIISDNASTDDTEAICARYLDDPRVRYHRNDTNIGGANNENRTFELSLAPYFRLAAHDDVCAPTLFERCVEVLDQEPDVVLVYTTTVSIGPDGAETEVTRLRRGIAATPAKRFWELAFRNHSCEPTYGVVRSEVFRLTGLQKNYTDSDRVLLCDLALRGRFVEVDEPLFFKRYHPKNQYMDWRARMAWFVPERKGTISFPNWSQARHLTATAFSVPRRPTDRLKCVGISAYWIARYSPKLVKDVLEAARALVLRSVRTDEWRYNWE